MRRGWRVFWIICAILTVIGLICCAAAVMLGVSIDDMSVGYYGSGVSENFNGIEELDIDTNGHLIIESYDGESILVEAEGSNRWKVSCQEDGDILKIRTKIRWAWFGNYDTGTVYVYVPEGYVFGRADISISDGKADVLGLKSGQLKLEVGAGEGLLKEFETDDLKMGCDAGRIEAAGTVNGDIRVSCGVGEAVLELSGAERDYNHKIVCDIGRVVVGDSSYSGIDNERRRENGADKTIDIDCSVGKVTVDFER